jgi:hypothetical protein
VNTGTACNSGSAVDDIANTLYSTLTVLLLLLPLPLLLQQLQQRALATMQTVLIEAVPMCLRGAQHSLALVLSALHLCVRAAPLYCTAVCEGTLAAFAAGRGEQHGSIFDITVAFCTCAQLHAQRWTPQGTQW